MVPDLALMGATATLFYLFALFGGATALFRDSDTGWHIRNGEQILAAGALPGTDPFSFSKPLAAWIPWEWAADVVSGAAHQVAGLRGVAFVSGLAIAATVWLWFRVSRAAGGNFLLTASVAAPMISTMTLHWLARPHVFSWLFLLGAVWFCETMPKRLEWGHYVGVIALSAIWANTHGSFFFGPVFALIYAAGHWLRHAVWAGEETAPVSNYLIAAGLGAAGSLLNPSGWNLHRHIFSYLTDTALLDRIGEFQSFNFHSQGAGQITLAIALCFAGGIAALGVRKPERFLLSMLLGFSALRMARAIPIAAVVLLPLAVGSITRVLSFARGLKSSVRQSLDTALKYGDRLEHIDRNFHGLAWVPVIVLTTFAGIGNPAGFPPDQFPVAASQAVSQLPSEARIFSPDKFGGYLIYRFNGQRKVFFDGRSDFYGAPFLISYSRMVQAKPGWKDDFAGWNFTHALVPADSTLAAALKAEGWVASYSDSTAVLLAKSGVRSSN